MGKSRKIVLVSLMLLVITFVSLTSVLASQEYDDSVYKVSSSYSDDHSTTTRIVPLSSCTHEGYTTTCSPRKHLVNRIHYAQYGDEKTRKNLFGDYVKEYSAYVTNRGVTGRYYTVVFELEDKNGYTFTQSVTQYLRTGEKKRFVYRDIQYERNEILDWSYTIVPQRH
jgi:hypothetical protein